jgi:hypothetical protein
MNRRQLQHYEYTIDHGHVSVNLSVFDDDDDDDSNDTF